MQDASAFSSLCWAVSVDVCERACALLAWNGRPLPGQFLTIVLGGNTRSFAATCVTRALGDSLSPSCSVCVRVCAAGCAQELSLYAFIIFFFLMVCHVVALLVTTLSTVCHQFFDVFFLPFSPLSFLFLPKVSRTLAVHAV